jgi:hypothetical protein
MISPKGALWAENCPNFLAGKTEVFSPSGGKFIASFNLSGVFNLVDVLIYQIF